MTSLSMKTKRKAKSTGNPVGRPPLHPDNRRVRLDSLVTKETRRAVVTLAKRKRLSHGKVIDAAIRQLAK